MKIWACLCHRCQIHFWPFLIFQPCFQVNEAGQSSCRCMDLLRGVSNHQHLNLLDVFKANPLTWLISKPSGQGKVMHRFIPGNSSTVLGVYFSTTQEDYFHVFEPITGSKDKTLPKLPIPLISASEMARDTCGNGNQKMWNKINNNNDDQQSVTRWLTSSGNATKFGEGEFGMEQSGALCLLHKAKASLSNLWPHNTDSYYNRLS